MVLIGGVSALRVGFEKPGIARLEGHGQRCPHITRKRKCRTLVSATILAGALSGSVIAQTLASSACLGDANECYRFIRSYLTECHRWGSPLFLLRESYGTLRAAALASVLAENGVPLNGAALLEAFGLSHYLEATAMAWIHALRPAFGVTGSTSHLVT